jgi:S1-C subfamily serine protease
MSDFLRNLSDAVAAAVENASRGVVRIEARRRFSASGIVWSADGVIVTADHVIKREDKILVGLPNGETVAATLVGRDASTDVAVLKVQDANLTPLAFAESNTARVGDLVLAVARPGQNVQATLGIISAHGSKKWRSPIGGLFDHYLQADVSIYPGFSGGPLLSATGHAWGLNSSALLRHANVTIPISTLRRVAGELLTYGRIRRGYLGIGAQPVYLPQPLQQLLEQETGMMLISVEADSPAEKAGLLLGDIIVSVNGQAIRNFDKLLSFLSGDRIGEQMLIRLVRSGQLQELKVLVGERS